MDSYKNTLQLQNHNFPFVYRSRFQNSFGSMSDGDDEKKPCCQGNDSKTKRTDQNNVDTTGAPVDECPHCKHSPCFWIEEGYGLQMRIRRLKLDGWPSNEKRKEMYQMMTAIIHKRPLGKGNRRPLRSCVMKAIRRAFPRMEKCPKYMGYRER